MQSLLLLSSFGRDYGDYIDFGAFGASLAAIFVGIGLIILVIAGIVGLGFYILKGYGLYKMAQRRGIENPWLAFIPVAQEYIIGALLGDTEIKGVRFNAALVLPIGAVVIPIAASILSLIPGLGGLLQFALYVVWLIVYTIVLFRIFNIYKPESATLYTVLSVIFSGIAMPIIFFSLRNTDPVNPVAFGGSGGAFEAPKNPFDN